MLRIGKSAPILKMEMLLFMRLKMVTKSQSSIFLKRYRKASGDGQALIYAAFYGHLDGLGGHGYEKRSSMHLLTKLVILPLRI